MIRVILFVIVLFAFKATLQLGPVPMSIPATAGTVKLPVPPKIALVPLMMNLPDAEPSILPVPLIPFLKILSPLFPNIILPLASNSPLNVVVELDPTIPILLVVLKMGITPGRAFGK